MDPYDVIIKPVITEKSSKLLEEGKYTFEVDPRATRTDVKMAVEKIFGVKVKKVNMITLPRKPRGFGRYRGMRKAIKKAVVTLEEGQRIDIFGGV